MDTESMPSLIGCVNSHVSSVMVQGECAIITLLYHCVPMSSTSRQFGQGSDKGARLHAATKAITMKHATMSIIRTYTCIHAMYLVEHI